MKSELKELTEENKEIYLEFEKKVRETPLNKRLQAALLFEIFEEGLFEYEKNVKFNDEEHEKYDDKIAELTDK